MSWLANTIFQLYTTHFLLGKYVPRDLKVNFQDTYKLNDIFTMVIKFIFILISSDN